MHSPERYKIELPWCHATGRTELRYLLEYYEEQNELNALKCSGTPEVIGQHSPVRIRRLCESIGVLFRREFNYDFRPYVAEPDRDHNGDKRRLFLWSFWDNWHGSKPRYYAYGAVGFEWIEWKYVASGWELAWAWFHPFERCQGHLTAIWPYFLKRFPDFWVQQPLSSAMKSFLARVGYDKNLEQQMARVQAAKLLVEKKVCEVVTDRTP